MTSSNLVLAKDEVPGPGGKYYLNVFDLSLYRLDSSSGIYYSGNLDLQSAASMPPVPGTNDAHLPNLVPPDPAGFASPFPEADANCFGVGATEISGHGYNDFDGHTLTSSGSSVSEPSTLSLATVGIALVLVLGFRRKRRRSQNG